MLALATHRRRLLWILAASTGCFVFVRRRVEEEFHCLCVRREPTFPHHYGMAYLSFSWADVYSVTLLSLSALPTTLTDDKAIAAAAMIGESNIPKTG